MVQAIVPATTANLGPGFDVLGLALNLYNTFTLSEIESGLVVEASGNGAERLSKDENNLAYIAAKRLFDETGHSVGGLRIGIDMGVPLGRGLGSSSTAIVGGLAAANELCGGQLSRQDIFALATEIEGHPDNVGPAIFGGFTICYARQEAVHAVSLKPSNNIKPVVLIPSSMLETKKARSVLPESVAMADAVFNIGRSSILVAALLEGRPDMLRDAMEDRLHQPYRAPLVPGMDLVIEALSSYSDIGVALSGAGPSILCLVARSKEAEYVELIKGVLAELGQDYAVVSLEFDLEGVTVKN
ncbi:MAG: homoserine kinase [Candidatus Aquicultor sp.]|nr:homoserine kinase [Candidatus Aquicultor sp.]